MFSEYEIEDLRKTYRNIKTLKIEIQQKIKSKLERLDNDALLQLLDANINVISIIVRLILFDRDQNLGAGDAPPASAPAPLIYEKKKN